MTWTDAQRKSLWAGVQGLFPNHPAAGSVAVQRTWMRSLERFTHAEVVEAFRTIAEHTKFPDLADVVGYLEAEREAAAARQPIVPRITTRVADLRAEWRAELEETAQRQGWPAEFLAARLAEVDALTPRRAEAHA